MVIDLGVLPVRCIGENWCISNEYFKNDVSQLNKTKALELIAGLNLATTNMASGDEPVPRLQMNALRLLKLDGLIADLYYDRLRRCLSDPRVLRNHPALLFFSRVHAFEMYRAISQWAEDHDQQSVITSKAPNKIQLIRSILMSWELFEKRGNFQLLDTLNPEEAFKSLSTIRLQCIMSPVSNPLAVLGKAELFMDRFFFATKPAYKDAFETKSGITLEDYRHCATAILASVGVIDTNEINTLNGTYDFTLDSLCEKIEHMREAFTKFLALESMTVEELEIEFKGQTSENFLNLKALRSKPILKISGDRYIALDLFLMAVRATYGPFFFNTGHKEKFDHFGTAFEKYVQQTFVDRFADWGFAAAPAIDHPLLPSSKDESIPQDMVLSKGKACVLAEIKAGRLNEEKITLSPTEFWNDVCEKFSNDGESPESGSRKGIRQLSYAIKGGLDGSLKEDPPLLSAPGEIIPLMIVHDFNLVCPWFGYFFAKEFWKHFDLELPQAGWQMYANRKIHSPIVMSIVELENLEHIGAKLDLLQMLKSYSADHGERIIDLREYLCGFGATDYSTAMKKGKEMIDAMKKRFWPELFPVTEGRS